MDTLSSVRSLSASSTSMLKRISREDVRLIYKFERLIGEGSFGTVRVAHKTNNPDKKFAIKSILREKIEKSRTSMKDLEHELSIMI